MVQEKLSAHNFQQIIKIYVFFFIFYNKYNFFFHLALRERLFTFRLNYGKYLNQGQYREVTIQWLMIFIQFA